VIAFFSLTILHSQVQFYAVSNAEEVILGSYFNVEFVIENASPDEFIPPGFKGFKVLSGPNRSSKMSIINGVRSQKESFGYTLIPEKAGNLPIGPAKIRIGKKTIQSKPLTVKVLKSGKGSRVPDPGKDVFVKAELFQQDVYFGQQILLNYVLYTRKRISGFNVLSLPSFDGILAQETVLTLTSGRKVIDGKEYATEVLKTFALIPQKTGKTSIDPMQLSLGLAENDDPFGFSNQSKPISVSTNGVVLNVLPLPDHPSGSFNGGVGKFTITSELSPLEVTTDDAVSLQLTITGNGLSKYIEAPKLSFPGVFEVYDPTELSKDDFIRDGFITGTKTFEYLLVPLKPGKNAVQVSYDYFDPEKQQYVTLSSPGYMVSVSEGKKSGVLQRNVPGANGSQGMNPLMTETGLVKTGNTFSGSVIFWILLSILLLAIPLMFWFKKRQDKEDNTDPVLRKSKKASREAQKRLAKARDNLNSKNHPAFYKALSEALLSYASDKFNIQTLDLSKSRIESALRDKTVPDALCQQFNSILEKCEMSLFAGINPAGDEHLYAEAIDLISKLEKHIRHTDQD